MASRGLSPTPTPKIPHPEGRIRIPVCAQLSLLSEGAAGTVTLSLACVLPRCGLRHTAVALRGWRVSVGSGDQGAGVSPDKGLHCAETPVPTTHCKVEEGRCGPKTRLQTVILDPGRPFFPDRKAWSLGRPSFRQDSSGSDPDGTTPAALWNLLSQQNLRTMFPSHPPCCVGGCTARSSLGSRLVSTM